MLFSVQHIDSGDRSSRCWQGSHCPTAPSASLHDVKVYTTWMDQNKKAMKARREQKPGAISMNDERWRKRRRTAKFTTSPSKFFRRKARAAAKRLQKHFEEKGIDKVVDWK
jgi:hypothetical protein